MFSNKHIQSRVKIIIYQSLIRPILSYGSAVWFNISPSYMKRLRRCERKILRSCLHMLGSPSRNYLKYYSNLELYNAAKIIRIDNQLINLTRLYILRCLNTPDNPLINTPFYEMDVQFCLIFLVYKSFSFSL